MDKKRIDGRGPDQLREIRITNEYLIHAEGSVLIEMGRTKVICTASVEDKTAQHLKGTGKGWVTAEYGMLPRSTGTRKVRDATRGKIDGRTQEIQRLIGRALRAAVDMDKMGERTVWIDCDVIQADGGTRTASITGAFIAMVEAFKKLRDDGRISTIPVRNYVSAISVGIVDGDYLLDLCYEEDSTAAVDMNVAMTDKGEFIEVQGTGEESPFSAGDLARLLELAERGCTQLIDIQRGILGEVIG